jgi:hypothetical protein
MCGGYSRKKESEEDLNEYLSYWYGMCESITVLYVR